MDIDPGTVVANRYRISRPLGRGGMGEVFAAENIRTGRPVAVKLLRSDTKGKSSAVARFRQEARAAGEINSDHVTQVLDVEEDAEHGVVLVFELLEGESLIDRLKRTGPISMEELHPIIDQVWMGLADAHRAGIVHRDLKPSNVFLERRPDGTTRVKILDFGISKIPKELGGETLTEMGQSLGTFSFMPPEQIGKAKTVDHRADIYACATLIYQSLSGQLPYSARNILVMVEMKAKTDGRKLSEVMTGPVDARVEAFLAQGLARDPANRFQTANEALSAWRDLKPMQRSATLDPASSQRPRLPYEGGAPPRLHMAASETPPHHQPLPIIDMNTDTAATLSMPNPNHAAHGARNPQARPRVDPRMNAPPAAPVRPIGLGGTQPVMVARSQQASQDPRGAQPSPHGQGAALPLPPHGTSAHSAAMERPTDLQIPRPQEDSSAGYDEPNKAGNLQPHPAGYYLPPAVAASLAQVRQTTNPGIGGQAPTAPPQQAAPSVLGANPATSSQLSLPKLIDNPTSMPASSSARTTVFRPSQPQQSETPRPRRLESTLAPASKRSSFWTFAFAALACLVVGFAIVAGIMRFLR